MAYRVGKRYLLRAAVGLILGGAVGFYYGPPTDRISYAFGVAVCGLVVAMVLGALFDVLSVKVI
jgi:hypothetical protein